MFQCIKISQNQSAAGNVIQLNKNNKPNGEHLYFSMEPSVIYNASTYLYNVGVIHLMQLWGIREHLVVRSPLSDEHVSRPSVTVCMACADLLFLSKTVEKIFKCICWFRMRWNIPLNSISGWWKQRLNVANYFIACEIHKALHRCCSLVLSSNWLEGVESSVLTPAASFII